MSPCSTFFLTHLAESRRSEGVVETQTSENSTAGRPRTRCSWCTHSMLLSSGILYSLQDVNDLKRQFDKLLKEWKPKDFHRRNAEGIDAARVRSLPSL
jgi:hypothetical protein